jgi:hypothetical protein
MYRGCRFATPYADSSTSGTPTPAKLHDNRCRPSARSNAEYQGQSKWRLSIAGQPSPATSTSVANQTPSQRATHIEHRRQNEYLHKAGPGCPVTEHDNELSSQAKQSMHNAYTDDARVHNSVGRRHLAQREVYPHSRLDGVAWLSHICSRQRPMAASRCRSTLTAVVSVSMSYAS